MQLFFKQKINLSNKCLRCIDYHNHLLAIGTLNKCVFIVDTNTKEVISKFDFFEQAIYSIQIFEMQGIKIAIGCADGNIYLMTIDGDIQGILEGHQGIVNSISIRDNLLASGSWDGTCKIWNLQNQKNIETLKVHQYAISVCFAFNNKLITGQQDGIAKVWDQNFKMIKQQKVHEDIIRCIQVLDNNDIVTCSNDSTIKILDQNLEISICKGKHKSFIYNIHVIDNKYILSGGEDFQIKVHDYTNDIQIFPITSIVWGIVSDKSKNEIYCACETGELIVLSDQQKDVDMQQHEEYIEKAKIACLGNPEFSEEQKKKFLKVQDMDKIKGKKEGEVRVFMNGDKGEAYCWQQGKWNLIGEVLANSNKSHYPGDKYFPKGDYDFIFNIESEDGGKRLLPFNKTDNALISAEKFLAKEQLSVGYKEQIVNFINKNARINKNEIKRDDQQNQGVNIEQEQIQKQPIIKHFPIIDYIYYTKFNSIKFIEKLKEINDQYKEQNNDKKLNLTEFVYIENIVNKLKDVQQMNMNDLKDPEILALQKLLKWNDINSYLVMDLFRIFCMHRDSQQLLNNVDYGAKFIIFAGGCLRNNGQKYTTLVFYFLINLFKINPQTFIQNQEIIFDIFEQKQQDFTIQDQSKLLTLFNQYLCYYFQQNIVADVSRFYNLIKNIDLQQLLQKSNELASYILALGNCILFENKLVIEHLQTQQMKLLIDNLNCKPPNDVLLNEIKQYVKRL